jgi:hypothetical protein
MKNIDELFKLKTTEIHKFFKDHIINGNIDIQEYFEKVHHNVYRNLSVSDFLFLLDNGFDYDKHELPPFDIKKLTNVYKIKPSQQLFDIIAYHKDVNYEKLAHIARDEDVLNSKYIRITEYNYFKPHVTFEKLINRAPDIWGFTAQIVSEYDYLDYEKVKLFIKDVLELPENTENQKFQKESLMMGLIKSNTELLKESEFNNVFNNWCKSFNDLLKNEFSGGDGRYGSLFFHQKFVSDNIIDELPSRMELSFIHSNFSQDEMCDKIAIKFDCDLIINFDNYLNEDCYFYDYYYHHYKSNRLSFYGDIKDFETNEQVKQFVDKIINDNRCIHFAETQKGFNLLKSCLDFLDKKDADKLNEFINKHQSKQQKKFGFKL